MDARTAMISLLVEAQRLGASDLHLTLGCAPLVRINGDLVTINGPLLRPEVLHALVASILAPDQLDAFVRDWQVCCSATLPDVGTFRVTLYRHHGLMEASIRITKADIPSAAELGIPDALMDQTARTSGLVLITGPTGHGKTTTLNVMIDRINQQRRCKVVTVEDPIEFRHENVRSIVVQQEVGTDTKSFERALVHTLRQDPDVIAIGEMRDLETVGTALTAAETGHLVLATLHSNDCPQTIHRIVDVFPERQQSQVRYQLALTLRAVIHQRLLPRADGKGRVLAYSLLLGTLPVQNLIREGKIAQIGATMESGRGQGMVMIEDTVRDLYQRAIITYDSACGVVPDPKRLQGVSSVRMPGQARFPGENG